MTGGFVQSARRFVREPAKRVFAAELREVKYQFKGDANDDKSPTFVLLPTGERCSRVFIVGTLTERSRVGEQSVMQRARISDPTGIFFVTAGEFQRAAMERLMTLEISVDNPAIIAVVGKPNAYETQDGRVLVSVRAETVSIVDQETRYHWIADTARATLDRLDALGTTDDSRDAQAKYPMDPAVFRKMAADALDLVPL